MLSISNTGIQSGGLYRHRRNIQFGRNFIKSRVSVSRGKQLWEMEQGPRLTAQGIEGNLQALLQVSLPRLSFHSSLVEKLLSLRLVSFELGNLGSQTISFRLQRSIFGREFVYLGL
jgi:hypothetical protein